MNKSEKKVYDKYKAKGYDILKCDGDGTPDFMLIKDGVIRFIEVKYARDRLSEKQHSAKRLLESHGFDVKLERVPRVRESILLKKHMEENINESKIEINNTSSSCLSRRRYDGNSRCFRDSLYRTEQGDEGIGNQRGNSRDKRIVVIDQERPSKKERLGVISSRRNVSSGWSVRKDSRPVQSGIKVSMESEDRGLHKRIQDVHS